MTDQGGHPAMTEPTTPQQPTPESRAPWTFDRREGEPFTLANAVFQALGRASTCWESLSGAGVFDSTTAKDVGDALLLEIRNVRDADNAAALARLDPSGAVAELLDALRLTVEYVGTSTLPPIPGWSWYDALRKYAPALADEFVEQHRRRARPGRRDYPCHWCTACPVFDAPDALLEHIHQVHPSTDRERAGVLAQRLVDTAYDMRRDRARAGAYLQRGDHLAAVLTNLVEAVDRECRGAPGLAAVLTEPLAAARHALTVDPEQEYGKDIPPPRTPGEPAPAAAADLIPPEQLAGEPLRPRTSRRRPTTPERPTLCRIVRYVGKHGIHATRAAVVSCTVDELDPAGDAPALTDPMHVHLFVTTPSERGSFVEYNVPYDAAGAPGTWHWPPAPAPTVAAHIGALHISPPPEVRYVPVPIDPRGGGMRA